jgi:GAF domain-containing protein
MIRSKPMAGKKGRAARRGEPPKESKPTKEAHGDLKQKRDAFLETFFQRGAALTEELVVENRRLRSQIEDLEEEGASLRTQLASDDAIRDLLKKIGHLEREKARRLSAVHEHAEITNRFAEVESELESFANLYVASSQLHASLRVRTVVRNVRELLLQLVGVRSLGIYFVDDAERHLVPIASDGVDLSSLPKIALHAAPADSITAAVERAFLTGVPHVTEGPIAVAPAACIPLEFSDRVIGVIVIYALLGHKNEFVPVDRELLKLLEAQAGSAIVSAYLLEHADALLPSPDVLRKACA